MYDSDKGNLVQDYYAKYNFSVSNIKDVTTQKIEEFIQKAEQRKVDVYYEDSKDFSKFSVKLDAKSFAEYVEKDS